MEMSSDTFLFLLIVGVVSFAIAVFGAILAVIGLVQGLSALRNTRDHPNRLSLRLAALNLLEPSVTIALTLALYGVLRIFGSGLPEIAVYVGIGLVVWILPSFMLLAPFLAPATLPFRNEIATWGRLRWISLVSLWGWIAIFFISLQSGNNSGVVAAVVFIALVAAGVVLMQLSLNKIVPIVRELRAVEKV